MRSSLGWIAMVACALVACREPDGPSGPGAIDARVFVESDPAGAIIRLDDVDRGITPDTIGMRAGEHTILLSLDSAGIRYAYSALFSIVRTDSLLRLSAPLGAQCGVYPSACHTLARSQHEVAGMRIATSATGSMFHGTGSGQGLFWPANSVDTYVSGGMPVIAGTVGGNHVALGAYDLEFLAGRPAPRVTRSGGRFTLTQHAWVSPPSSQGLRSNTAHGIEIREELIGDDAVPGVVLIRLTFRNITNEAGYFRWASHLPPIAQSYTNTFIGFILDADIGVVDDDWVSYDLPMTAVYTYDAAFFEPTFTGDGVRAPGVVGLRAVRIPVGTHVVLNAWNRVLANGGNGDWGAGLNSEVTGHNMLTGVQSYAPDHPSPTFGHMPPSPGDARISVTAGPLTLAPGQEAEIVLALAIAAPTGPFTSGTVVQPGDPSDMTRAIHMMAAGLRARLQSADALLPLLSPVRN